MLTNEQQMRLKEIAAETFGVDLDEIDAETSQQTLGAWSSYAHLSLMAAVEEAFEITFSMDEMISVHNFAELEDIVSAHL